jgi:asparaginyl-tRNA synthetase
VNWVQWHLAIYTLLPTFRAENSNTTRHLAEFWMIEPEVAFNDLEDNMNLAEEFIQYLIRYVMEHNYEDLEFLDQRFTEEEKQKPQNERQEFGLIEKLKFVTDNQFERITYTEAIDILLNSAHYKKKKFKIRCCWGIDMQSELFVFNRLAFILFKEFDIRERIVWCG